MLLLCGSISVLLLREPAYSTPLTQPSKAPQEIKAAEPAATPFPTKSPYPTVELPPATFPPTPTNTRVVPDTPTVTGVPSNTYTPTPSPTFIPPPTFTPTPSPTPHIVSVPTYDFEPSSPPSSPDGSSGCSCSGNIYNCKDFGSHASAQACYEYCISEGRGDIHGLDGDNDGSACESLP